MSKAACVNTNKPVLVVGTTADYIDWIRQAAPNRALFLTDPDIRREALEPAPEPVEEILCALTDASHAYDALTAHLHRWHLSLSGVACFDCESMELAATLAQQLSLPYPSLTSIRQCRDKFLSKTIWQQQNVSCPRMRLVRSENEATAFQQQTAGPIVLKPLAGSGSELVFRCAMAAECGPAFSAIIAGIKARQADRLYADSEEVALAEEYVKGAEYSCDFILEAGQATVIRLTKKIPASDGPFGTIQGYILVDALPDPFAQEQLADMLRRGAEALGLTRAICMADFLVRGSNITLLEMTPRLGGDCLPFLLRRARHLDMLLLALDFAQQRPSLHKGKPDQTMHVGLRLHAKSAGVVRELDTRPLLADKRLREIHLIRQIGDQVRMPPEDYKSWYLGHLIFQPSTVLDLEGQCHDLADRLVVTIN
jgi:hypothetical protein